MLWIIQTSRDVGMLKIKIVVAAIGKIWNPTSDNDEPCFFGKEARSFEYQLRKKR